jgi:hypothetical protein
MVGDTDLFFLFDQWWHGLVHVQIKDDVDMIERNKDEEAKRFLSHNIHFDFAVLVRIKECMVDLSSNCLELALKVLLVHLPDHTHSTCSSAHTKFTLAVHG